MPLFTIGPRTFVWNNRLRCLALLLLYPIIITSVFIAVIASGVAYVMMETRGNGALSQPDFFTAWTQSWLALVTGFWYLPYAVIGLYLMCMYFDHANRLNLRADERIVTRESHAWLYDIFERLCILRGVSTLPYLTLREDRSVNAYTEGMTKNSYKIVLTTALVSKLAPDEVEAVLAHELSHILHGDTQFLFLVSLLTGIFEHSSSAFGNVLDIESWFSNSYSKRDEGFRVTHGGSNMLGSGFSFFLLILFLILKLGNIGTLFAHSLISRRKEFNADMGAITLTQNPQALIKALRKANESDTIINAGVLLKPRLFYYHNEPWAVFPTHPQVSKRIAVIRELHRVPEAA